MVKYEVRWTIWVLVTSASAHIKIKLLVSRAAFVLGAFAIACIVAEIFWRAASFDPRTLTLTCISVEDFILGAIKLMTAHTATCITVKVLTRWTCFGRASTGTCITVKGCRGCAFVNMRAPAFTRVFVKYLRSWAFLYRTLTLAS